MAPDTEASFPKRMKIVAGIVGNASLLADRTGISRRAIGLYLAGKSDPTREKLVVIASAANVNLAWLATGAGPVFAHELQLAADTSSAFGVTQPVCCCLHIPCLCVPRTHGEKTSGDGKGGDKFIFSNRFLQQEVGVSHDNQLLVRIPDDAMAPTLKPDDLVLINRGIGQLVHDGIYAITLEKALLVRRIQRSVDGAAYVICDNPVYERQRLDRDEVTALKINGKAIWAGKRI